MRFLLGEVALPAPALARSAALLYAAVKATDAARTRRSPAAAQGLGFGQHARRLDSLSWFGRQPPGRPAPPPLEVELLLPCCTPPSRCFHNAARRGNGLVSSGPNAPAWYWRVRRDRLRQLLLRASVGSLRGVAGGRGGAIVGSASATAHTCYTLGFSRRIGTCWGGKCLVRSDLLGKTDSWRQASCSAPRWQRVRTALVAGWRRRVRLDQRTSEVR